MRIRIFDDVLSIFHTIYGLVSGILDPIYALSFTLLFGLYEYIEYDANIDRDAIDTLGDIIEYTVGLLVGAVVRTLTPVQHIW